MIITLDGPCGSGKSTLAQLLARRLNFFYMNSGYLYRSLVYILITEFGYDHNKLYNPDLHDICLILDKNNFVYQYADGVTKIFFKGREITDYLKMSAISHGASIIAVHSYVRNQVVPLQQYFGMIHNLVTDGRDCGTEIYPDAQFKFYVTAASEIRAQRLQADLEKTGIHVDFQEALEMTLSRDERDINRLVSPLKKAHDAIEIDTSDKSIHQILDLLMTIIAQ